MMPVGKARSTERFFFLVSLAFSFSTSRVRIMAIPKWTVKKIKTRCVVSCAWHREYYQLPLVTPN